jgi:hypothetical protein
MVFFVLISMNGSDIRVFRLLRLVSPRTISVHFFQAESVPVAFVPVDGRIDSQIAICLIQRNN